MRVHGHRSPLIEEEMPGSLLKLIHISSEEHMSFHKYVSPYRMVEGQFIGCTLKVITLLKYHKVAQGDVV